MWCTCQFCQRFSQFENRQFAISRSWWSIWSTHRGEIFYKSFERDKMRLVQFAIISALISISHVDPSNAISRYNANSLSCQQLNVRIAREGAAIIRYRSRYQSGLRLFDRFVRNGSFCQPDEIAKRKTIPTAGGRMCSLRYCKSKEYFLEKR